jgi:hypothetical protein
MTRVLPVRTMTGMSFEGIVMSGCISSIHMLKLSVWPLRRASLRFPDGEGVIAPSLLVQGHKVLNRGPPIILLVQLQLDEQNGAEISFLGEAGHTDSGQHNKREQ